MSSNLPPPAERGVFCILESKVINASPEKVWDTLLDFQSYREWNPFVRSITILDSSAKPATEQNGHSLTEGTRISMQVHIPATLERTGWPNPHKVDIIVNTYDNDRRRVEWSPTGYPAWLLRSRRWQTVSTVEDGTLYETREVFAGPLVYLVNLLTGRDLRISLQRMAEALKTRAEQS
ncbi:hypothetical protein BD410DRAFT_473274 [Rickenella mellea]|uniref:Coenzyme Q-binding protein COQ10 START domain-containing protein n=1 Tax=Rickenella mellea TaxID=50990 RepID=A0A4Y7QGU6_9AGAM|nr:hypothetical protein BD410DRAFT_473274 [Rickenella mellea]